MRKKTARSWVFVCSAMLLLLTQGTALGDVCLPHEPAAPMAHHSDSTESAAHVHGGHQHGTETPATADASGDCCGDDCACPSACSGSMAAAGASIGGAALSSDTGFLPCRTAPVATIPEGLFRPPISA